MNKKQKSYLDRFFLNFILTCRIKIKAKETEWIVNNKIRRILVLKIFPFVSTISIRSINSTVNDKMIFLNLRSQRSVFNFELSF
jgi:hypothetical protein